MAQEYGPPPDLESTVYSPPPDVSDSIEYGPPPDLQGQSLLSKGLSAAGTVLGTAAKVLEPLRTPTVGLGGIAAGAKELASGGSVSDAFSKASESIKARAGLGREIVSPVTKPGLVREIASIGVEAVTDPTTYLVGPLIAKLAGRLGPTAAKTVAAKVATMTPEESVAHLSELANASRGPEPLIKVVQGLTPKDTLLNIASREARPTLTSEQILLGQKKTTEASRSIASSAINKIKQGQTLDVQEGEQISEAVARAVKSGEIDGTSAAKILGIEIGVGKTAEQVASAILKMKSEQGRGLNAWSLVAREFKTQFSKNKAVQDILKNADVPETLWDKSVDLYRRLDNFRRAAMVSQLATTARNIISQGTMGAVNAVENGLSGALGVVSGKTGIKQGLMLPMENVLSAFRAMTPSGKAAIENILNKFPIQAERFIRTPIGDVTMDGKAAQILNTFNTFQETYFRRAALDAHLRQTANLAGKSLTELTSREVAAGVDHALSLTFSKTPKSGPGAEILKLYRNIPFLTALGNPFPRFWINAVEQMAAHSPLPMLSKSTYAAMASSDPRTAFGALSKVASGATLVGAGYALDQAGHTGEKWYEIKVGDKRYDARPFAPFSAALFAGRMLSRVQKEGTDALLKVSFPEWSQAFLSMKRTDATGLPFLDMMFARSKEEFVDKAIAIFSGYASSFVPGMVGKTVQDISGQFNREERLPRFTRERPLTGAAIANIPFLERTLPVRSSALRGEPEERQSPLLRQLTGLSYRVKTPIEIEVDRLGLVPTEIYPRTGMPEYDRLIVSKMGPLVERTLDSIITSKWYLVTDDKLKREIIRDILSDFRSASKGIVRGERPDIALKELEKKGTEFVREQVAKQKAESTESAQEELGTMAEAFKRIGIRR